MMLWMLLTLGAFLLIVHPITVSQARNLVEQAVTLTCTVFSPLTGTRPGSRR